MVGFSNKIETAEVIKIFTKLYGIIIVNIKLFKNSGDKLKNSIHKYQLAKSFVPRQINPKVKINKILYNIFNLYLLHTPNPITSINEVDLMISPIHPEELYITARKSAVINQTVMPEEIPETAADKKMGISEKSNCRKGKTGKIEILPINPSTIDSTINTELYVILRAFRLVI